MNINHNTRALLPFALAAAILAVSASSLFIRFAQMDGMPSLVIAALRLTIATLLLAPVVLTRHRDELKRLTPGRFLLGAASGVFLAVHFATWISSLEYTSVASSVVFVATGPLWVAVFSSILLKENISRIAVLGLVLALLGGVIIGLSDACTWSRGFDCPALEDILQGRVMWGNFLALCGAWAVTGYLVIGRRLRNEMTLMPYIFLVYGAAAATLTIFMLVSGQTPLGFLPQTYAWVFFLAAIPQLLGHSTYNWALKYLPATLVAVVTLGEPIASALLAFFFLNESPAYTTLAGGGFILVGIYLASNGRQT